jgi:hypothetical protein
MSFIAASVIAGGATLAAAGIGAASASGMFGGGGGGGGGGGMNLKEMTALLDRYKAEAAAITNELNSTTGAITSSTSAKVDKNADEYLVAGASNDAALFSRIDSLNKGFIDSLSVFVDKFPEEVNSAIQQLKGATDALNAGSRADTVKQLTAFAEGATQLDAKLRTEGDDAIKEFLDSKSLATSQYETKSDRVIDATKAEAFAEDDKFQQIGRDGLGLFNQTNVDSESRFTGEQRGFESDLRRDIGAETDRLTSETKSLGDLFLEQITGSLSQSKTETEALRSKLESGTLTVDAQAEAARSIDFNAANASRFIGIADELSQGAFNTRQRLVDQADPRARELSAIVDENASALMSGRISADTQANLARSSAMRALSGGFGAGSDMGRGLAARDLGLTSLDLMRQGTDMNDGQRRLMYDTRVTGTQVDPFGVMQQSGLSTEQAIRSATSNADMMNRDRITSAEIGSRDILGRMNTSVDAFGTNFNARNVSAIEGSRLRAGATTDIFNNQNEGAYRSFVRRGDVADTTLDRTIGMAESGRNTRIGAINDAGSQRLQSFDRIFNADLGTADTVRGQRMTQAQNLYTANLDVGRDILRTSLANTNDIYNNMFGLSTTIFNAGVGTAEKMLGVGVGAVSDIYKTGTQAVGNVYDSGNVRTGNIFSGKTTTANNMAGLSAAAAIKAADIKAVAAGGAAQGGVSSILQGMVNDQGNRQANANLWGSAIQSGATLAGSYMGSQNWFGGARNPYGGSTSPALIGRPTGGGAYSTAAQNGPPASALR